MKYNQAYDPLILCSRSREGAWIEIHVGTDESKIKSVAPVRERGLKSEKTNLQLIREKSLP